MRKIKFIICVILVLMTTASGCGYHVVSQDVSAETGTANTASVSLPSTYAASDERETGKYNTEVDKLLNQITGNNNINATIILKDGDIIMEHYKNGFNENSVVTFNSCAKSVMSILIGIAIDQGLIEGVDTKLSVYFPEIANDTDDRKQEITIKHLLEFTPGFNWPEWGEWNYWPGEFVSSENWVDFVLSRPMDAEPGTEFAYNTGASQLLSAILQKTSGEDALSFAEKNLLDSLDIQDVDWGKDPQGITTGGFQISMKPGDAAKIGLLYLNKGNFNGNQIVSKAWVAESTQAHSDGGYFGSKYGYHWWVESGKGNDYYYAMGYGGQYIFVAPEFDIVVVFASNLPIQQMGLPKTYFEALVLNA